MSSSDSDWLALQTISQSQLQRLQKISAVNVRNVVPLNADSHTSWHGWYDQYSLKAQSHQTGCAYVVTTLWLHCDYVVTMLWLHCDYVMTTLWLRCDYVVTTLWLCCDYGVTTVWLRYDYVVTTLLLRCDYVVTTLWLHSAQNRMAAESCVPFSADRGIWTSWVWTMVQAKQWL